MTIGICTWTLGIDELDPLMAKIASLELDAVQYCEPVDRHSAEAVAASAASHGLSLIAVDPFDHAPHDSEEATAENAVAFYRKVIDFAADLGGVPATIHGLTDWTGNCDSREAAWEMIVECGKQLAAHAEARGIELLIEPCNRYEIPLLHTAADAERWIADIGSDRVRPLLDSFHMHIEEKDPYATLERFAERSAIYHISDSNRGGIGEGRVDFINQHDALKRGGFSGPVAVELVLPHLAPTGLPRNAEEQAMLDDQIRHSARVWRLLDERRIG
ncbi:sugar phosphate isomerase/epimerase family protein [Salinicola rhizosphaerae]|uniref:Xylose isomerase-like TIM barrel domain-containing protein n=1 Tax=Salinicola rhizosphaerae TaxID=1443141 RepID=A0ABQ3DZD7_9GAMM|nr:sugar phosphate isomerase/epimerase family protein [Salinicola rhizosphaerae]GHB14160.1 hypothetical protein GCM10009038_10590 [Salinicola rhizosphaerae]